MVPEWEHDARVYEEERRQQVLKDIDAVLRDAARTHPAFAQMAEEGVLADMLAKGASTDELSEWLETVKKAVAAMRAEPPGGFR